MDVAQATTTIVPLERALQIIAAQLPPVTEERLNSLAGALSALVPLYRLDGGAPRQLSEEELHRGLFRKAGGEIYFADGRPAIGNLGVTPEGIARVMRILQGSALQD